ncbi:MAG: hypothetical protein K1060chlam5_01348 [Candidatus Anoxychlamydiales bacterium]|nr:hypothetical protein [Candidatus Anoxychlamydiales bacterium]
MKRTLFLFLFFLNIGFSIYVGNPSEPILLKNSIIKNYNSNFSLEISYLQDYIYRSQFQDKFESLQSTPSDIKILSYLSILTLNIINRIDINILLGSSDLKVDRLIKTKNNFSYGLGLKAILFNKKDFDIGFDFKYFTSTFKPTYFVVDDEDDGTIIYDIIGSFKQRYEEYIGSLLISYKTPLLTPYIGASFIYADLTPKPSVGKIFIPEVGEYPFVTSDSKIKDNFGMVIGVSIINLNKQINLSIENRLFNQNAISATLQIRY